MTLEPIRDSADEPAEPHSTGLADCLTDQQDAFATVVGRALAEAWRRKWQKNTSDRTASSRRKDQPTLPPH